MVQFLKNFSLLAMLACHSEVVAATTY